MTIVFSLLALFNAWLVAILLASSRSRCFGRFADSMLNPVVLFSLFQLGTNIDFILIYNTSTVDFIEMLTFIPPEKIVEAYSVFTLIECGAVIGLFLAISRPVPQPQAKRDLLDPDKQLAAAIFFALYSFASFYSLIIFLRLQATIELWPLVSSNRAGTAVGCCSHMVSTDGSRAVLELPAATGILTWARRDTGNNRAHGDHGWREIGAGFMFTGIWDCIFAQAADQRPLVPVPHSSAGDLSQCKSICIS